MLLMDMDRRTTAEQAADEIRNAILSGKMKDGAEIIQEQVASDLGLSRMPVREALKRLESEGLIERMDNRRTRVIGVTNESLVTRIRLLCEITRLAVGRLTPEGIEDIVLRFVEIHSAKTQLALHGRVFELTDDRFLRQMYEGVFSNLLSACLQSAKPLPDAELLIEAIKNARRPEKARALLESYYGGLIKAIDGRKDI